MLDRNVKVTAAIRVDMKLSQIIPPLPRFSLMPMGTAPMKVQTAVTAI